MPDLKLINIFFWIILLQKNPARALKKFYRDLQIYVALSDVLYHQFNGIETYNSSLFAKEMKIYKTETQTLLCEFQTFMNNTGTPFFHVTKHEMQSKVFSMLYNLGTNETELLGYDTSFMQHSLKEYLKTLRSTLSSMKLHAMLKSLKPRRQQANGGGGANAAKPKKHNSNGLRKKPRNGNKTAVVENVNGGAEMKNVSLNGNAEMKVVNGTTTTTVVRQIKNGRRRTNNNTSNKLTKNGKNKV